jgi:hypothetical protein
MNFSLFKMQQGKSEMFLPQFGKLVLPPAFVRNSNPTPS